jgi:hypothetical protein
VGCDREAPGRTRAERHGRGLARFEPLLDVIAVQVNDQFVIRSPAQGDVVALLDANVPLARGQETLAD